MSVNLSALDLNLFLVLHAVLEERSATRAAARLHVTQSAISNALARLRELLGDPLVVRKGRGLVPTPRAEELIPLLSDDGQLFNALPHIDVHVVLGRPGTGHRVAQRHWEKTHVRRRTVLEAPAVRSVRLQANPTKSG